MMEVKKARCAGKCTDEYAMQWPEEDVGNLRVALNALVRLFRPNLRTHKSGRTQSGPRRQPATTPGSFRQPYPVHG